MANLLFYGLEYGENERRPVFLRTGISHKTGKKPTLLPGPLLRRRLSFREGFPTPKIALIQQNAAPLFRDIPDSKPVWLSEAFSQQKMTSNSTYWEAKL